MSQRFGHKDKKNSFQELNQEEENEQLQHQQQLEQKIKKNENGPISLEDETQNTIFGNEPIQTRCQYCGSQTLTEVNFQNGILTYILVFLSLMIFGLLLSLIIIPIIFVFTKQLVHTCSLCEQEIGTNQEIIFGSGIKDGIISLKLGEFGFIISRRIILTVVSGILAIILFYNKITNLGTGYGHSHLHDKLTYTNTTWTEFIEDCGLKSITTHQKFHQCQDKYIDQTVVEWKGYIIRVEDFRQSINQYLHHAISILVKMEESETEMHPDVHLTFDSEYLDIYENVINQIDRGDHIGFNATIKTIGTITQTRHLHVVNIWKEDGHIDIPAHIHNGGRYDDSPRRMRGKSNQQPPQIESLETEEILIEEEEKEKKKEKESKQNKNKDKTQNKTQNKKVDKEEQKQQNQNNQKDEKNSNDESQDKMKQKFEKDKNRYDNIKNKKIGDENNIDNDDGENKNNINSENNDNTDDNNSDDENIDDENIDNNSDDEKIDNNDDVDDEVNTSNNEDGV